MTSHIKKLDAGSRLDNHELRLRQLESEPKANDTTDEDPANDTVSLTWVRFQFELSGTVADGDFAGWATVELNRSDDSEPSWFTISAPNVTPDLGVYLWDLRLDFTSPSAGAVVTGNGLVNLGVGHQFPITATRIPVNDSVNIYGLQVSGVLHLFDAESQDVSVYVSPEGCDLDFDAIIVYLTLVRVDPSPGQPRAD